MKRISATMILLAGLVLVAGTWSARAQLPQQYAGPMFYFDEDGHANAVQYAPSTVENNWVSPWFGSMLPDPTYGIFGGLNVPVLTYMLPWNWTLGLGGFVPCGDVPVFEFGSSTFPYSDICRFTDANGHMTDNYGADRMIFYSLRGGVDLADTGLPSAINLAGNGDIYGSEDGGQNFTFTWGTIDATAYAAASQIEWQGISGPGPLPTPELWPTPEPSTLALLGIGAIGLLPYAWRQRRRTA